MAKTARTLKTPISSTGAGGAQTQTLVKAEGTGPAEATVSGEDNKVDTEHPDWEQRSPEWQLMEDTSRGSTAVKEAGEVYLPMPPGFKTQTDKGVAMYAAYVLRAQFPTVVNPTIMGMLGIIHRREAKIEMPEAMEPLWERATKQGLPLEAFHRMITYEVLKRGRYSVLVDADPEGESKIPYLAGYTAPALINWGDNQDLYVLDESGLMRNGFEWVQQDQWRVLSLEDGKYIQRLYKSKKGEGTELFPMGAGGKPLERIPFVVIGPRNLSVDTDDPPLIGVGRAAVSMYQLSADYRYQLFMTGQETMFCINMDPPNHLGAGVVVTVDAVSKDQHEPKAFYVSPQGVGIDAHKEALNDEREAAAAAGASLFDTSRDSTQESGEAKRVRYAAQTATLLSIAMTSAAGLETALRHVAVMMNLDPEKVVVTPNLRFVDSVLSPQDAVNLVKLWQENAISYETLYENLQRGEIASDERDVEEERKLIDKEIEEMTPEEAGMLDPITGLPVKPGQPVPPGQPKPPAQKEQVAA